MFSEVFPSRSMGRLNHSHPFCFTVKAEGWQLSQRTSALHLQTCDSPGEGMSPSYCDACLGFCLLLFIWLVGFLLETRVEWLLYLLPGVTLRTWKVTLQGKASSGRVVNVSHQRNKVFYAQWDVYRCESSYSFSDLKMSSTGFRGNTPVCKSENPTHWSYF